MKIKPISFFLGLFVILVVSCSEPDKKVAVEDLNELAERENVSTKEKASIPEDEVTLHLKQANRLATLPFNCMQNEYPNKTGQVLNDSADLGTPRQLHPAFYGCFDWHSSVHGHWSLVKLMKQFPELENRDSILLKLQENISRENIGKEIDYFKRKQEYSYERMYGWSWLLKLQLELNTWDDESGEELAQNLQPLSDLIIERYIEFLPKLNYPLRVGMHSNTAFGLSFAWDYAEASKNEELLEIIRENALRLFVKDKDCPIEWEPDGFDFLSPCLEEVDLMVRVLPRDSFEFWIEDFLPELKSTRFQMDVAEVSDREDGHLVHLDGLNFSRAWVLYRLAKE